MQIIFRHEILLWAFGMRHGAESELTEATSLE
jgi:hypothetical protein